MEALGFQVNEIWGIMKQENAKQMEMDKTYCMVKREAP